MTANRADQPSLHPSLRYAHPWTTAEAIFGSPMAAAELIGRIRDYSWAWSFRRLAKLAAVVANEPGGPFSETVKRLTVDALATLTGAVDSQPLLARGRATVTMRRNEILLAHEEVILFLEHLVLLEGGETGMVPSDAEIALWLAAANGLLQETNPAGSTRSDEGIAATLGRASRFNNAPDMLRTMVRTYLLFSEGPPYGALSDLDAWQRLQQEAFGSSFVEFFETCLGLLSLMAKGWGIKNSGYEEPVISISTFLAKTEVDSVRFEGFLRPAAATRAELMDQIPRRPDGLPADLMALTYSPLVEVEPHVFIPASPWAVLTQLGSGVWASYLRAAKRLFPKRGAEDVWLPAFGYMVEGWCRRVAKAAQERSKSTIVLSSAPGVDEIEDIVVLEDGGVVLFSVKATMMAAKVARQSASESETKEWFEKLLFVEGNGRYANGAARLLNTKIGRIRVGEFEEQGIAVNAKVFPVLVTFDSLGESDPLYEWIDERCASLVLLQQEGVGPLTLCRISEFEHLMGLLANGKLLTPILSYRQGQGRHRRLDQIIGELEPDTKLSRLPFMRDEFWRLSQGIRKRFFGRNKDARGKA